MTKLKNKPENNLQTLPYSNETYIEKFSLFYNSQFDTYNVDVVIYNKTLNTRIHCIGVVECAYLSQDGVYLTSLIPGNMIMEDGTESVRELYLSKKTYPNLCKMVEDWINVTGDMLDADIYNDKLHGKLMFSMGMISLKDEQFTNQYVKWVNSYSWKDLKKHILHINKDVLEGLTDGIM